MMARELILASVSPRRADILNKCGLDFRVEASYVDEIEDPYGDPVAVAQDNAQLKALAVGRRFPDAVVIAADTIVLVGNRILGKPACEAEAMEMFDLYRQGTISVYSGVALVYHDYLLKGFDRTDLIVRMEEYGQNLALLKALSSLDKSGGFTIEGLGSLLFDQIQGSYYNVLGLPVHLVARLMAQAGLDICSFVKTDNLNYNGVS